MQTNRKSYKFVCMCVSSFSADRAVSHHKFIVLVKDKLHMERRGLWFCPQTCPLCLVLSKMLHYPQQLSQHTHYWQTCNKAKRWEKSTDHACKMQKPSFVFCFRRVTLRAKPTRWSLFAQFRLQALRSASSAKNKTIKGTYLHNRAHRAEKPHFTRLLITFCHINR